MFEPHPDSGLEYWFFKLNHGDIALLVDWIARRETKQGVLRISIHSPVGRQVLFSDHPAILMEGARELSLQETSWGAAEVQWQLSVQSAPDRIRPQIYPAEQLRLFDLSLVSAPDVTFSGWIRHRTAQYPVVDARGMLSHYWGRALPEQWWWISANQFDVAGISIECAVLRSRVWGGPIRLPLGYLYFRSPSQRQLMISPPARIGLTGSPEAFELKAQRIGGPGLEIRARGRQYGSLGDGIINTLVGDLEIWQSGKRFAQALGTAALERRTPDKGGSA